MPRLSFRRLQRLPQNIHALTENALSRDFAASIGDSPSIVNAKTRLNAKRLSRPRIIKQQRLTTIRLVHVGQNSIIVCLLRAIEIRKVEVTLLIPE